MSGDPEQEYFTDGLTEDIITELSRVRQLFVIARTSSFYYKGKAIDVREIGRELGVRYVLEGSVRRNEQTIRVSVQLVDATTGGQVWAENRDRDLTASNVFGLQDEIAERVVNSVGGAYGAISRKDRMNFRSLRTESLDSYECVLRSYKYEETHTAADHLRARECLQRTVEVDPGYSDAWAHLAMLTREEFQHGFNARPSALDRALRLSRHALDLDPDNQNAYYSLAFAHFGRREIRPFVAAAERAIELNPNNARVVGGLGVHLAIAGEWERGLDLLDQATRMDPHFPGWQHFVLASDHYRMGRYRQALDEIHTVEFIDLAIVQVCLAAIHGQLDNRGPAQSVVASLLKGDPTLATHVEEDLRKFFVEEDVVEHFVQGLRKTSLLPAS